MQLRLLPFLCLYATVHIQFIAAFPNHGTANQIVHNPNANQGQTTKSNGVFVPVRTTKKTLNSEWKQNPSTLRTGDNIDVEVYNSYKRQFEYFGLSTIHITKNHNTNIISMVVKHKRDNWKTINVWNIKDVTLFDMQNDFEFELAYWKKNYMFRFIDSQKAKEFHQIIKDAQTENLLPVPTVTQSVYQAMHDVESTTSGNQGSNGMVSSDPAQQINYSGNRYIATPPSDGILSSSPTTTQFSQPISDDVNRESTTPGNQRDNGMLSPDQTQHSDYSKRLRYTADIWKLNDQNQETNYGKSEIKIIQHQDKNTVQVVGERIPDKQILIDIYDITLVQLSLNNDYIEVYWGQRPYCGFHFQENQSANAFYQSMLKAQRENKQAPQVSSYINPSTTAIPKHHNSVYGAPGNVMDITHTTTASVDQNDIKLQSVLSQQKKAYESRFQYTADILILNRTSQLNENYGKSSFKIIKFLQNNTYQIIVETIPGKNILVDIPDIKLVQFNLVSNEVDTKWDGQSYTFKFDEGRIATKFHQTMLQAQGETEQPSRVLPDVSPSAPAVAEQNNPVSGDLDEVTDILPAASDDKNVDQIVPPTELQQNNTDESRSDRRVICTVSTEYYDCQIQRVHLKIGETYDFGLTQGNKNHNITFGDSTLQYLPKTLIDAFPDMKLLNLNHLDIEYIESNSFDTAENLETLYLEGNRLTDFPSEVLTGALKLKTLVLSNNNIYNLQYDFLNNNDLNYLFVDRNQITKLPAFDNIPQLKSFNASYNNLSKMNSSQFIKQAQIENIDLSNNRLKSLTLQLSASSLSKVDVSNNRLTQLSMPLVMKHLYSENNMLSKFIIDRLCYIQRLKLSNNTIKRQPDLKLCNSLQLLDLSSNKLQLFDFSNVTGRLGYLNLAHNYLFEIIMPVPYENRNLKFLYLSHNKLTYLPSLQSFTSLIVLTLNDNNLIKIGIDDMPNSLQSILVTNNEWNCADVPKLAMKAKDKINNHCKPDYENMQGICCKRRGNSVLDEFNVKIREVYFHEQSNRDKQKEKCAQKTKSNQNSNINAIRQAATIVDEKRAAILHEIEQAQTRAEQNRKELDAVEKSRSQSKNNQQYMASVIEKQRKTYRVINEGLISDKERLSRVIKFITERKTFNQDLKVRRQGETDITEQILLKKQQEKESLFADIKQQTDAINTIKTLEKDKKKIMDQLQKKVNRNSPAIHGKTGKS